MKRNIYTMLAVAILLMPIVASQAHADAWYDSSFMARYPIIQNNTVLNNTYSINDTNLVKGHVVWAYIVNQSFIYSQTAGYGGSKVVATNTTQDVWENETSRTGNGVATVWNKTGVTAVWHFGETTGTTAFDSSQNGVNGTYINSTGTGLRISNSSCQFGNCIYLNGTDMINVTATGTTLNPVNKTFSIAAWVRPQNDGGQVIAGMKINNSANYIYKLGIMDAGAKFGFSLFDGTNNPEVQSNTTVTNGTMYFVVGVYSGTNITIYVNGILQNVVPATNNVTTLDAEFDIGKNPGQGSRYYKGYLDELRQYNRVLTRDEVQQLYRNGNNNLTTLGAEQLLPISISIGSPANVTYYGNTSINFSFVPLTTSAATVTCWSQIGSTFLTNNTVANNTQITNIFANVTPKSRTANVTCSDGVTNFTSSVMFYIFQGLNITGYNAGNNTDFTTAYNLTFTNSSGTFNYFNVNNNYSLEYDNITGVFNITVGKTGFRNKTFANYQNNISFFNTTRLGIWKEQYFYALVNSTNATINSFSVSLTNGVSSYSDTTNTGVVNISLEALQALYGTINATYQSVGYNDTFATYTLNANSALNVTALMPVTTFNVTVFDESNPTSQLRFNATISNSTSTFTYTNQSTLGITYGSGCTGACTITVTEVSGAYYARTYYVTISSGASVSLVGYVLPTTGANAGSPIVFHIQNSQLQNVQGAVITIQKLINSVYTTVGQATSDATGNALIYLSQATSYQVIVVHPSYPTFSQVVTITTSPYFITLGSGSTINYQTGLTDISFAMLPDLNRLNRAVNSNINFTAFSSDGSLLFFGLNVTTNGTSLYFVNTSSASGGTIVSSFDTSGYQYGTVITAVGFFQRAGYPMFNVSKNYILANTAYNSTTLAGAIDDISQTNNGFTDVSRGLLALFLAAIIVGSTILSPFIGSSLLVAVIALGFFTGVSLFPVWAMWAMLLFALGWMMMRS